MILMRTIPVIQVVSSLVIGLFLLRLTQQLTARSENPIAQGVSGGLTFLLGN